MTEYLIHHVMLSGMQLAYDGSMEVFVLSLKLGSFEILLRCMSLLFGPVDVCILDLQLDRNNWHNLHLFILVYY